MELTYPSCFYPDEEKSDAYAVVVPDLPGFVSMLVSDMDAYTEKYGEKAVKKNLTTPAWLYTFAEKNHNYAGAAPYSGTKPCTRAYKEPYTRMGPRLYKTHTG